MFKSKSGSQSHHKIDVAYYINLPHRVDRRIKFEKMSKFLPVKEVIRFEAIDGKYMAETWPGTPGAWGCRESHIKLLELAKAKSLTRFIIIEDDAVISKHFAQRFHKFLADVGEDWDMLYLYAKNHYLKPIKRSSTVIQLQNTLGTVGIVYNSRCIDIILDKIKNDDRWIDSSIADLHPQLKVFAPSKSLLTHPEGYSDNVGAVTRTDRYQIEYFYLKVKSKLQNLLKRTLKWGSHE